MEPDKETTTTFTPQESILTDPQLTKANAFFLNKEFEPAIETYQKYIENYQAPNTDIDGLGNN